MRPICLLLCALCAALPLLSGCATGSGWTPFASGSDRPEKMVEVELAAERSSPWGRKPAAIETAESESKPNWFSKMFGNKNAELKTTPPPGKYTRPPIRTRKGAPSTQDQATRAYLDRELREATPEERNLLCQQLQGQDQQMVQQIAKVWKMSHAAQIQQRIAAREAAASPRPRGQNSQRPTADSQDEADETAENPSKSINQPAGYLNTGVGTLDPWKGEGSSPQFANPNGSAPPNSGYPASRGGPVAQTHYADPNSRPAADPTAQVASRREEQTGNQQNGLPVPAHPAGYTRAWSLEPNSGDLAQANRSLNTQPYQGGSSWQPSPPNGNVPAVPTAQGGPAPSTAWAQPPGSQPPTFGQNSAVPWGGSGIGARRTTNRSMGSSPRADLGNLVPGQFQAGQNGQGQYGSGPSSMNSTQPVGGIGLSGGPTPDQVNAGIQTTNFHSQPGNPAQDGSGQTTAWNQQGAFPQASTTGYNQVQRASWQMGLQQIISVAETQTAQLRTGTTDAERQAYIESHVYLRMLYMMAGLQDRAIQAIPGLDPADQEFWQQTFWGMSNYFDSRGMPRPSDRASQAAAQLTSAVQHLQAKANLELRNVSFCQKITSFGNYDRFPREEFTPGQQVLLYGEVQNFLSEATPAGQYRTVLRSVVEFYKPGPQGELLDRIEFAPTEDLCRSFRRDYFHSYEFAIPAKLSIGPHVVKLTVEDQLSHRLATYTLNFTVRQ